MTLDIREFHTHFIAIEDVPDHEKWKQHFVSSIDEELSNQDKVVMKSYDNQTVSQWKQHHNSSTSYFFPHSSVDYNDFTKQVVTPLVTKVMSELDFNWFPIDNIQYWYNRYDQMGTHLIHDHDDTDLCLIYILHLEEPNTTVFHNTVYNRPFFKKELYTEDLKEGQIIIFPHHLQHEVQWSEKRRYTIAGNINLNYEYKHET